MSLYREFPLANLRAVVLICYMYMVPFTPKDPKMFHRLKLRFFAYIECHLPPQVVPLIFLTTHEIGTTQHEQGYRNLSH